MRLAVEATCFDLLADPSMNSSRIRALSLSPPETRASLILRLPNAADVAAWDEMVAVYGPLVYRLARRKGLQPCDADDLVQEVLAAVSRSINDWLERPDRGQFRAWLFAITRNAAINFLTRPKHQPQSPGGNDAINMLAGCAAGDDVSTEFDMQRRRETFRWASQQVRETVTEKTWLAFWETTMEDRSINDVASDLGMTPGSIYIARSRIMAKLREIVRAFEERDQ